MQYTEIFFSEKMENFMRKILIVFIVWLKTYIVGTLKNRLAEVRGSNEYPQCKLRFGSKIRKIGIPLQTRVFLYKSGFTGVYISRTCFHDDVLKNVSSLNKII